VRGRLESCVEVSVTKMLVARRSIPDSQDSQKRVHFLGLDDFTMYDNGIGTVSLNISND
jgi:hypothetical protein